MKPLVIYHANCTDGFGAAYAAWAKLGHVADYLPMHYGDKLDLSEVVHAEREVYILDFSLPREVMDALFSGCKHVTWLDHHKTAFEMWCGAVPDSGTYHAGASNYTIVLDNHRSGALIAWEHFHPEQHAPLVIQNIDDRDRWQFKLPTSKEIHMALQSLLPWDFNQWAEQVMHPSCYLPLVEQGAALLRLQTRQVASAVQRAERCVIFVPWQDPTSAGRCPRPGLAVNATVHASEIGNELAKASGTYGLIWYFDSATKRANVSLRSTDEYDVSAIAKEFGGGGHRNAAGFNIDMPTLLGWMK